MKQIFFWNSLAFSMMQRMLAIWSLVPLPFLNSACTSGSSQFTYCWSLAWRIVSMWNEMLCSYSTWNNWKWNLFHFHPLATICLLTTPKYLLYVSFKQICLSIKKGIYWDFPGSSVVKTLPSTLGGASSIPACRMWPKIWKEKERCI